MAPGSEDTSMHFYLAGEILEDFLKSREEGRPGYRSFYFFPLSKSTQRIVRYNRRNKGLSYQPKGSSFPLWLISLSLFLSLAGTLLATLFIGVPLDNKWLEFYSAVSLLSVLALALCLAFFFPSPGLSLLRFKKHFSIDILRAINRDLDKGLVSPEEVLSEYRVEERLAALLRDEDRKRDRDKVI